MRLRPSPRIAASPRSRSTRIGRKALSTPATNRSIPSRRRRPRHELRHPDLRHIGVSIMLKESYFTDEDSMAKKNSKPPIMPVKGPAIEMSNDIYRKAIAKLELTQEGAGRVIGLFPRPGATGVAPQL